MTESTVGNHEVSFDTLPPESAQLVLAELQLRRKLTTCLASYGLSTGPNLEILLDVFTGARIGKPRSLSDIAIGVGLASSSATRWIRHLEENGFLVRSMDANDRRRMYLSLTQKSSELVQSLIKLIASARGYATVAMPREDTRLFFP
jgi:DNA-binding MarR family transcriptional regulator